MMTCSRCRKAMREERRSHHKKRKWVCKHCGHVTYQVPRKKSRAGSVLRRF